MTLKLLFNTPAYKRFELTEICLTQRVKTIEELAKLGIEADCVVIANDENLDTARKLGFHALESPNILGHRFNDGYEFAVKNKFDWAMPIGSDQVIDANWIAIINSLPKDTLLAGRWYTVVRSDGLFWLQYRNVVWCAKAFPVSSLRYNPRPCNDDIMRGCDTSTHIGIKIANPGINMAFYELHPLEYVQFGSGIQVTGWEKQLRFAAAASTSEEWIEWSDLWTFYPHMKSAISSFYGSGQSYLAT